MDLVYSYAAFLVAYLIGSISFAVLIIKAMGLGDPRTYGSKNPGATNVLRSGNKVAAALTLLLDFLKGFAPTALVQYYAYDLGFEDTTIAFVGVSAFLGHLFPAFFKFKGGKGVATAAGVLLAYELWLGVGTLAVWVAVAAVFRYASLASIIAAVAAPFITLVFYDDRPSLALAVVVMSLALIWRHWRNIVKLVAGKESRIGDKANDSQPKKRRRRRVRRLHDEVAPGPGIHHNNRNRGN